MIGCLACSCGAAAAVQAGGARRETGREKEFCRFCLCCSCVNNDKQIDLSSTELEMGSLLAMSDSNG